MGARAWAAARVSNDPQMQLWTPAPWTVTWQALYGVRQHDLKDQALLQHHSHGQIHQYFHHTFDRLYGRAENKRSNVWWKYRWFGRWEWCCRSDWSLRSCLIPPHNASQVTVQGARVQSCMCWSSETRAAGDARAPIFWQFVWWVLVDEISPRSRKARDFDKLIQI